MAGERRRDGRDEVCVIEAGVLIQGEGGGLGYIANHELYLQPRIRRDLRHNPKGLSSAAMGRGVTQDANETIFGAGVARRLTHYRPVRRCLRVGEVGGHCRWAVVCHCGRIVVQGGHLHLERVNEQRRKPERIAGSLWQGGTF